MLEDQYDATELTEEDERLREEFNALPYEYKMYSNKEGWSLQTAVSSWRAGEGVREYMKSRMRGVAKDLLGHEHFGVVNACMKLLQQGGFRVS